MAQVDMRLRGAENHKRLEYKPSMFASESQFDEISRALKNRFEPKIVFAHEMDNYEVVVMSDLRIIEVDDMDMFYDEGYEEKSADGLSHDDLFHTNITFYTNPAFTDKGYKEGEITNIPAMAKVCTIVKKDLDIFKDKVGSNGYLSVDEYNFLMT